MFIELTDHLRCPAGHDESFLVLIPDAMEGRRVLRGILGCPVCQAEYRITGGIAALGAAPSGGAPAGRPGRLDAEGALALLGLEGPGGFVALVGPAAALAPGLAGLLPGVHCVAVNPPDPGAMPPDVSVLVAPCWPLKRRSLRGIVLAGPAAADPAWREAALGSVLPGLRVVGEGEPPAGDLLAAAGGWWVARGPGSGPGAVS